MALATDLLAYDGRPCVNAWRMATRFGKVRSRVQRGKLQWYADFGRIGRIWSLKGEPFQSAAEAESILRAIQGDVARGTPKRLAVEKWLPSTSAANRVDRWLSLWVEEIEAKVESGDRSPAYLREIQRWTTPGKYGHIARLGRHSIHGLDYKTLRGWQRELPIRGKTLWNVTAGVSAFLGWLSDIEAINRKPKIPWPSTDEHVPAIVLPEIQDAILEAIPEARRGAFLAMARLGLRHSEAWVLDGRDYRDGRLWVRHARKGRRLDSPVRSPKNRQPRVLPVPEELAEWIGRNVSKETLLSGGLLFPNPRTGKPWTPTSFRRAWDRACKAAGLVPSPKPYETLRHSTATEWLRRGASSREVQHLLGHKTGHATPRYARLADGRLASIVERVRRRDRPT